jgi:hypothetical protein
MYIQRRQYAKPIIPLGFFKKRKKDQEHFLRLFFGFENQEKLQNYALPLH